MEEIEKQHKSESHKEFEKLLNLELKTVIKEGEIVSGTVSKITKKLIYVDIPGLKSEGAISSDEFKLAKEEVAVGDKINCLLEKLENKFGDVVVSREKARKAQSWKKMEKSFVSKEPVTGNIVGRVKGIRGRCFIMSLFSTWKPGKYKTIKQQ